MKKPEIKKLDKMWGEAIHSLYDCCAVCKKKDVRLEAHHIFTRGKQSTRWDLENGILLCSLHHKFDKNLSAHTAPRNFWLWLEKEKGIDWVNKLEEKSNLITKHNFEEVKNCLCKKTK